MSALDLLAASPWGSRGAQLCPHPARLESAAIRIEGRRRPFICCPSCLQGFRELIADWHQHRIGLRGVGAQMFAMGYTRGDVVRFQLQLLGDRIRLRLGLLEESAL